MKKILYVIIHGSMHPDRYDNIMDTWGKNVDTIWYSNHNDPTKNIIKMSERSDHWSCEERHLNMIRYCVNNIKDYEWFFFCDNDTFVNTKKMNSLIDTFDPNFVHGYVLEGTFAKDRSLKYCSGGAGYLIHHKLLSKIEPNLKFYNSHYGDVTLGLCLRDMGVKIIHHDYFKCDTPKIFNITEEHIIKEHISFHYIKTKTDMLYLHNLNN